MPFCRDVPCKCFIVSVIQRAPRSGTGGDQVQVGIVHNHMEYEPKHPLAFSAAWVTPIVRVINQAWVSTAPRMLCASSNNRASACYA